MKILGSEYQTTKEIVLEDISKEDCNEIIEKWLFFIEKQITQDNEMPKKVIDK